MAIFFLDLPFPLIIGGAALVGLIARRATVPTQSEPEALEDTPRLPQVRRSVGIIAAGLTLWLAPTVLLLVTLGPSNIYTQLAVFFSFAAVITFGGAYAILAFIAQQAVDVYGWLSPSQMVDGLGLAESTPGPLIMVVQFVGFMGAFAAPSGLTPFLAGAIGGLLVTWVTFVPSFTFIYAGAPYAEYLRRKPALSAALGGITAAVVGVIANLAAWFSLQTLFSVTGELRVGPFRLHTVELASLDAFALGLAIAAYVAMARFRWGLLLTLTASAAVGFAYYMLFRV